MESKKYLKHDLLSLLDLENSDSTGRRNESIITNEEEISTFKSELDEAYNMTLEKYSDSSQKLYDFLF